MDLLNNPFNVLGATPRDNRIKILELAEDISLIKDADICMEARSDLTTPRKRLKAEVAWISGVRPRRASELISMLKTSPQDALNVENLHGLAKINFVATALSNYKPESVEDVVRWILEISNRFDEVRSEQVQAMLNEERVVSGFPEINDISSIEDELQERRTFFRTTIKKTLDQLEPSDLVSAVTKVVDIATDNGQAHGPVLIEDIVSTYEIEAQEFLREESENIGSLIALIEQKLEEKVTEQKLSELVERLIDVVRNWDVVAQPIQVLMLSLGREHDASRKLASEVREFAIHMFNDYAKLDQSRKLTDMLQEVFAEVIRIAEQSAEDSEALQDIAEQQKQHLEHTKAQEKVWRTEVTYETEVGALFKEKLKISPKGIDWKGRNWPLEDIVNIRWGATKHSVNGIPTGTTYTIFWGTVGSGTTLELKRESTYSNFIDKLWKAVGVRLLTELLEDLGNGKSFKFGSATFMNDGVELVRKKFFGSNERVFCKWDELVIWNAAGEFCIGSKADKKLVEGLSYQDQNNVHILEAAIRTFWKKGGRRLSDILLNDN